MKKLSYWEQRALELEAKAYKSAEKTTKTVLRAYHASQEYLKEEIAKLFNRATQATGKTPEEMAKVIKEPVPTEELSKLSNNEKTALAYKHRITRLDELRVKAERTTRELATIQKLKTEELLTETVQQAYKETQEEIIEPKAPKGLQRVTEEEIDKDLPTIRTTNGEIYQPKKYPKDQVEAHKERFKELPKESVENVLNERWKGSNYSERIWNDRERLAERLEELFVEKNLTGMTEREMKQAIEHEFCVAGNVASRLIRTESNYIYNQGKLKGWQERYADGYYKFVAIVDERTSDLCRKLNDKIFKVSEAEVGKNYPPTHPNCRSTVVLELASIGLYDKPQINNGAEEQPKTLTPPNAKLAKNNENEKQYEIWGINKPMIESAFEFEDNVFFKRDNGEFEIFEIKSRTKTGLATVKRNNFPYDIQKKYEEKYLDVENKQRIANELAEKIKKSVEEFKGQPEDLMTVKRSRSKSQWYNNNELNQVSEYEYTVPKDVLEDAEKLRELRKSFQGSITFDFEKSKTSYIKKSYSDHANEHHKAGVSYFNEATGKYIDSNDWLNNKQAVRITPKKNKNSYSVNRQHVNSKQYHDKFEDLPLSKNVKESVYKNGTQILEAKDGKDTEITMVLDGKTGNIIYKDDANKKYSSGFSKSFVENSADEVVLIHNHPESGRLSSSDILTALKTKNVTTSITVGHDGDVHYIYEINHKQAEKVEKLYNSIYNDYKKNGYNNSMAEKNATDELYKMGVFKYAYKN